MQFNKQIILIILGRSQGLVERLLGYNAKVIALGFRIDMVISLHFWQVT